jgi:putative flippase GtrA
MRSLIKNKFIKFSFVGATCAFLSLGGLYFFTTILKIHYLISTMLTWISTNFIGFYLNKRYTFKTKKKRFWYELVRYYIVMFSSFLANLLFMYFLVSRLHIWYLHANFIVIIFFTFYNFLMHKNWSFKQSKLR